MPARYAITREQRQYDTWVLADTATQSRLELVPERGGIVTAWCVRDRELLYLDAERFANPSLSVRGGIPILFPICGNLPDDTYTYGDRTYTLRQHGFARELPWEVAARAMDDESARITLSLRSSDLTMAMYPFAFELEFTYTLRGNSLEIAQRVCNRGEEVMPFCCGLHPYFAVTDKTGLQFDIPSDRYLDWNAGATHPFTGQFDFEAEVIDVGFFDLARRSATLRDPSRSLRLELTWNDPYAVLVFWTVKGKDFVCLEPWTAPRNALNTGDRLIHLAPGDALTTSVGLAATWEG